MNSRERMQAALEYRDLDYVPCCFMLFTNLWNRCQGDRDFVLRQMEMGLDPLVHVGHLNHELHHYGGLHPSVTVKEWMEEEDGIKVFCRRLDTPAGPLTGRVRQFEGWPTEGDFPLMKDWIVPRAKEVLVKPEQDLEKLRYLFGPIRDEDVARLRQDAAAAASLASQHGLFQVGGWKGYPSATLQSDPGVMGCDAMAWLSGYEQIMELSLLEPELIREYARIIHEWNLQQIEVYLEVTQADLIIRRAWYETTEFWTPAAYRRIIAPFLKKEVDLVHQAGKKYGYIITSAFAPILDDILATGIDVLIGLDPEEGKGTDLAAIKAKFRHHRRAIWGGVSGAITVEMGTASQTEAAVQHALATLGGDGGLILSPVDNVRQDTPRAWDNTRTFIEAWRKCRAPTQR